MRDKLTVAVESDVAKLQLFGDLVLWFWNFEVFAGSACKEECAECELGDCSL